MAETFIFTDKEISFLKALVEHNVSFMIVGLSAAALQGAPVVTQDIDLWFEDLQQEGIRNALDEVEGIYVPPWSGHPPQFAGENINMFDIVLTLSGLEDFKKEVANAVRIPFQKIVLNVLSLERIIKSKETAGRTKDLMVLPVLKDALKVLNEK